MFFQNKNKIKFEAINILWFMGGIGYVFDEGNVKVG